MIPTYSYIIIGAGIAGLKAAESIRRNDGDGKILLINGEDRLPYKRTKISKNISSGFKKDDFTIADASWFETMQIEIHNSNVSAIALKLQTITDAERNKFRWKKLIIATGAMPLLPPLKGTGKEDIFMLRTATDAEAIIKKATSSERIIVAGGGVLGVEIAEQLVNAGKQVTLIHRDHLLLSKQFDPAMSKNLLELLQYKGVQVIFQEEVTSVTKTGNGKLLVQIGDLIQQLTDMVIFSIGVEPDINLAKKAGLITRKGIKVDASMQTSHPNVYAAGDVTEHNDGIVTGLWHAAEMQGIVAGTNAAGGKMIYTGQSFRMKLEFSDAYYFSMNLPLQQIPDEDFFHTKDDQYFRFFFSQGRLFAMLMRNCQNKAKLCEKAVREQWTKEMVEQTILNL
jgi:NAD(P)H-nitrite reductase large subunit